MATIKFDAKGLGCPLPIIRVSEQIKKLNSGDLLEIESDDSACQLDIRAVELFMNCKLKAVETNGKITRATIEKL